MRQILFGEQWFHPEAPAEVVEIFNRLGRKRTFKKGEELKHGAPDGEITLLLTGLCLYRFWDTQDKEHVLSLILPNRTMGDIDGLTGTMANVSAYTIKNSTGLVLPYDVWHKEIRKDINVYEKVAQNITFKQESHIEALLACFTLDIDSRLRAFLHSLIKSYYKPNYAGWNPMPVRLTATLIASIISASRTSVSLTLSDWTEKGWMKKDGNIALFHGSIFTNLKDWWEPGA